LKAVDLVTQERHVFIPINMTEPLALDHDVRFTKLQGETMGTTWQVSCFLPENVSSKEIERGIQACCDLVVNEMSHWKNDSHLFRFNHAVSQTWHSIPDGFFTVLDYALFIAEQTQGAYDPSIGHLTNTWGFGPIGKIDCAPNEDAIQSALEKTGWQKICLNKQARSILRTNDVHLDFSSIAKGYAVDQVSRFLKSQNIPSYLVEIGGELSGYGIKLDGQPWWVALETISGETSTQPTSIVALHDLAVATSGNYRRYFVDQDHHYSHTIDPRTGKPVSHGLASVTVFHAQCMIADTLATAMTVIGLKDGLQYANQLNIAALFTQETEHGYVEHMSRHLEQMLDD
jgi:thiamine biosynthesis lipoprotein